MLIYYAKFLPCIGCFENVSQQLVKKGYPVPERQEAKTVQEACSDWAHYRRPEFGLSNGEELPEGRYQWSHQPADGCLPFWVLSFRAENCTLRQFFDGKSIRLILFLLTHHLLKLLIQDGDWYGFSGLINMRWHWSFLLHDCALCNFPLNVQSARCVG